MTEPGREDLAGLVAPGSRERQLFYAALSGARRGRLYLEGPGNRRMMFGTPLSLNLAQLPRGLAGPEAVVVLRGEAFFRLCLTRGLRGLEDSHARGDWDSPDPAAVLSWIRLNREGSCFDPAWRPPGVLARLRLALHRFWGVPVRGFLTPAESLERRRRYREAAGGN